MKKSKNLATLILGGFIGLAVGASLGSLATSYLHYYLEKKEKPTMHHLGHINVHNLKRQVFLKYQENEGPVYFIEQGLPGYYKILDEHLENLPDPDEGENSITQIKNLNFLEDYIKKPSELQQLLEKYVFSRLTKNSQKLSD
jgi:hypothetical protein